MNAPDPTNWSPPRPVVLTILLVTLVAVMYFVVSHDSTNPSKPPVASPDPKPAVDVPEAPPVDQDAEYRVLALGTWQDDYKGKRTMHLSEDGTGTMIVEPSGLSATLFASRLEFDMVWSIEDGRMKKQTLGGRPELKVKAILSMMGDRVDEPILELSQDRLLLLDADGETQYDWRRVPSP